MCVLGLPADYFLSCFSFPRPFCPFCSLSPFSFLGLLCPGGPVWVWFLSPLPLPGRVSTLAGGGGGGGGGGGTRGTGGGGGGGGGFGRLFDGGLGPGCAARKRCFDCPARTELVGGTSTAAINCAAPERRVEMLRGVARTVGCRLPTGAEACRTCTRSWVSELKGASGSSNPIAGGAACKTFAGSRSSTAPRHK
jgi:hypothetical protein